MSMEKWATVRGFEGYEVSDKGRVRNIQPGQGRKVGRILMPQRDKIGRMSVGLHRDGLRFTKRIHVLVLEAFVGPRPRGYQACHNNGNASDNRLDNLRWDTAEGNQRDRWIHGTAAVGSKHGMARLTELQVRTIRETFERGTLTREDISLLLGLSRSAISLILSGKIWKHI